MSSENWVDISNFLSLKKGEMIDFDYNDRKIMIMNINGTFYASDRICTHAYVDLTSGILNESEKTVTCPLHLSSFDMKSGDPLNLPAEDPLEIYKIKKEKNKLFILL
ncbi:MAG TPA: Rieske 2Fe-2S domain-containing protein [Candidatus Nitrosocosmicus sp.]|jgi:3-phenylpropionate/trans-cinnamate dioxygenase ferredoxin subunit